MFWELLRRHEERTMRAAREARQNLNIHEASHVHGRDINYPRGHSRDDDATASRTEEHPGLL